MNRNIFLSTDPCFINVFFYDGARYSYLGSRSCLQNTIKQTVENLLSLKNYGTIDIELAHVLNNSPPRFFSFNTDIAELEPKMIMTLHVKSLSLSKN